MSAHLPRTVMQNCSSFLIKKNRQAYSTKPNPLKAHNSFCENRLTHHKMAGVEPQPAAKTCGGQRGAETYVWTISKNTRAALGSIQQHIIHKNKCCVDLCTGTASAIPAQPAPPTAPEHPLPPKQ